jgi:hypothetical protein
MRKLQLTIFLVIICLALPYTAAARSGDETAAIAAPVQDPPTPTAAGPNANATLQQSDDETRCQVEERCGDALSTTVALPSLYGPTSSSNAPALAFPPSDSLLVTAEGVVRLLFFWSDT